MSFILNPQRNGGAGSPPPWTPADASTLIDQWDFSDTGQITFNGSNVAEIAGSVNGLKLDESAGETAYEPAWSATGLLGKGAISFTGGQALHTVTPLPSVPQMFIAVLQGNNSSNDGRFYVSNAKYGDGRFGLTSYLNVYACGPSFVNSNVSDNTIAIVTVAYDGTDMIIRVNGVEFTAASTITPNNSEMTIGGMYGSSSFPTTGIVGEVAAFSAYDANDILNYETYLNNKWGVF